MTRDPAARIPDWADVLAHYGPGDVLAPLVGSSSLVIDSVDEDRLCVKQRLWRACLQRVELEEARKVLAEAGPVTALELGELMRAHVATGFHVTTECSRVPNLTAVVLNALGAFDTAPAGPTPEPGPPSAVVGQGGPQA